MPLASRLVEQMRGQSTRLQLMGMPVRATLPCNMRVVSGGCIDMYMQESENVSKRKACVDLQQTDNVGAARYTKPHLFKMNKKLSSTSSSNMNHENVLGKQDYNLQTSKTIHYFLL
jgi:hypothetical protein